MQTLLKILLRYSNFLVFIALEVAAFMLISRNNVYPRSSILSTANSFVAWQNEQIHEINSYFHLRSMNEQLAAENAALRNQICSMDSAQTGESFHYVPAKAVEMTTDPSTKPIILSAMSSSAFICISSIPIRTSVAASPKTTISVPCSGTAKTAVLRS